MQLSLLSLALSILPLTLAQYGSSDNSNEAKAASSSSSATAAAASAVSVSGKIHKVTVGKDNTLLFSPDTVTAAVGDFIEWHFYPQTHSVLQSSFGNPCAPSSSGFTSGGFATTSGENANVFRVQVNSTDPLWYYCGFPGHCQGGMVGVINPPSNQTIQQYITAASTAPSVAGPRTVNGGVVGAAAVEASASGSATQSAASPSATGNSGAQSRGGVQWAMLGMTGVVAVVFGRLVV